MNKLDAFNSADESSAISALLDCCNARTWANTVAAERPFESLDALIECARRTWSNATESDHLEAFAAHPLIGDVELLKKRYAISDGEDRANVEQGQVLNAQSDTIDALAQLNIDYRSRHGFIFIVYAADKSAEDMLTLLTERIDRSTDDERETAAAEQMKITELRLTQMMSDNSGEAP